jgi:uncharacterized damage-inducible protein DinB
MSEHAELLQRFRRGPELLASLLTGVAGREFDYSPAAGKWSIRQIMAHLVDSEMLGAIRFRMTLAQDNPALPHYDQDLWATKLDYPRRKVSDCLESFRRLRRENFELLAGFVDEGQEAEAFGRGCQHPKRGAMTVAGLLVMYTEHAENHAAQIKAIRDAYRAAKAAGEV